MERTSVETSCMNCSRVTLSSFRVVTTSTQSTPCLTRDTTKTCAGCIKVLTFAWRMSRTCMNSPMIASCWLESGNARTKCLRLGSLAALRSKRNRSVDSTWLTLFSKAALSCTMTGSAQLLLAPSMVVITIQATITDQTYLPFEGRQTSTLSYTDFVLSPSI